MPNWAFGTVKVTGTREGVKSFVERFISSVSANIKCTETPTESAVHFFFFIDQMRRR